MVERARFVEEWSERLAHGSATLFVGAGTSIGAGYPSWRALLGSIASELGLDIEEEHDLAAVTQFYINKERGRGRITQLIAKQFPNRPVPTPLRLAARLPLRQVWTTNWDELIERAFRDQRREADVKERAGDLTYERPDTDVTVYKMHGSIRHLDDIVLATDDFELYRVRREAFLRVLAGHLISTSFLFIGVSFTDPNLGHLLGSIREMYERHAPTGIGQPHYALLRRPHESDYAGGTNAAARFKTASIRHSLFVDDLKRYNVHAVEIETYEQTDEILREVEQRIALRSVFISGSLAPDALPPERTTYIRQVAYEMGKAVANAEKHLVSGYGLGLGDQVLSGMLGAGWLDRSANLDRRLMIRPFPQTVPEGVDREEFWRAYREDMVARAGTCIAVAGIRPMKDGSAGFETATGVLDEIRIAKSLGRLIIPIGATGGASEVIWKAMLDDPSLIDPRIERSDFEKLGDAAQSPDAIGKVILKILRSL